jgi:hypothetical protein
MGNENSTVEKLEPYEVFALKMEEKFPKMFKDKRYGGFAVGEGWWPILEVLCSEIYHHVEHKRKMRARDLRLVRAKRKGIDALIKFYQGNRETPSEWQVDQAYETLDGDDIEVTPRLNHITVQQIKEKFGGLRFYYDGGDDYIRGLESMAERWAGRSCETCGERGDRRGGGWIRTLCDKHEAEHQENIKARNRND